MGVVLGRLKCLKLFFQLIFIYASDYFLFEEIVSLMICFNVDLNLNLELNWIRLMACVSEIRLFISRELISFSLLSKLTKHILDKNFNPA